MTQGHFGCQGWTTGLLVNSAPFPNSGWLHGMSQLSFQCDQPLTYNRCIRIARGIENTEQHADIVFNYLYCYWSNSFYFSRRRILKCGYYNALLSILVFSLPGTLCPTLILIKPFLGSQSPYLFLIFYHIYLVVLSSIVSALPLSTLKSEISFYCLCYGVSCIELGDWAESQLRD